MRQPTTPRDPPPREIRFGAYVRELTVHQHEISYNDLVPELPRETGEEPAAVPLEKVKLRPIDTYRLIRPYVQVRLAEQLRAVVPLALYLALFQVLILNQRLLDASIITGGLLAAIVGLMLFMEGLKVGLMPLGESMGTTLPAKASLPVVLTVILFVGIGVTFAEPAIGALKTAGSNVEASQAPYLWDLLNRRVGALVWVVGISVGLAAVLGTLRFLKGWSLKPLITVTLVPTLGLTVYFSIRSELATALGLAWDSGAVTTGPVTVPLVLALGIGIAAAAGKGSDSLSGFGIVTLASLFPIIGVMALTLFAARTSTEAEIAEAAAVVRDASALGWHEQTPGLEITLGIRAIVPLVLFLLFVMRVLLRERLQRPGIVSYGIGLCVSGMVVFNLGLTYGLAKLGGQAGSMVPGAFTELNYVSGSPLFHEVLGIVIALLFAWFLGFGATLAEPALNALGHTVEHLTNGAFRKRTLMYAVSVGVGCGIALGVAKVLNDIPIAYLLVPGYALALLLTWLSSEAYVNVAWDSAGVTTGPVTVPLVLAMGLGFGGAMGSVEGFGILSLASVGPIVAVLATGLIIQRRIRRQHEREEAELKVEPEPA